MFIKDSEHGKHRKSPASRGAFRIRLRRQPLRRPVLVAVKVFDCKAEFSQ